MNHSTWRNLLFIAAIWILVAAPQPAGAYYGWESTDDPVPYYDQQAGKWYYTQDTKTFMVTVNERTYKYVFEINGHFLGGYVTDMPIRLP